MNIKNKQKEKRDKEIHLLCTSINKIGFFVFLKFGSCPPLAS
jgi:hypothetical protein